jgi:hypothetical protein
MTKSEIAQELKVDQSTISRDVKALKQLSQQFIYNLARSDLSYYYKQSIDGIEEPKREAWRIYHNNNEVSLKEKLSALKLIVEPTYQQGSNPTRRKPILTLYLGPCHNIL